MSDELAYASIVELGTRLRRRELSSEELVRALIARTEQLDPKLNSYITFLPERALDDARAADARLTRGDDLGPLHGIPVSVKDHIDTAGIRTSAGAKYRLTNVPATDAAVVRRLKAGGAVLMGKANMNRFAGGESGDNPDFGRIKTPWNLECSAGGSSGGSGAMVAAGLVPLSIGTDNGGSIRIPAAVCGIVGVKATFGRVSMDGVNPRAYSFDHAGPLTRTVEDAAVALRVVAGHDPGNETTLRRPVPDYRAALAESGAPLRIGVDPTFAGIGMPAVLSKVADAVKHFASLGASVREVTIPPMADFEALYPLWAELGIASGDYWRQNPADFGDDADVAWQVASEMIPAVDYIRATQHRRVVTRAFARVMKDVDIVACPSYMFDRRPFGAWPDVGGRAATFDDATRYSMPFDFLGVPAVSVPCGFTDDGFPIGLQLVGRAFDEVTVLRAARTYEQSTEWHRRRPPI